MFYILENKETVDVKKAKELLSVLSVLSDQIEGIRPKIKTLNTTAFVGTVHNSFFGVLSPTINSTDMKLRFYFEQCGLIGLWESFENIHDRNKYSFKGADQLDHDGAYLCSCDEWLNKSSDILNIILLINSNECTISKVSAGKIDGCIEHHLGTTSLSMVVHKRWYELLMKIRDLYQRLESNNNDKESAKMTQNISIGTINSDQIQVGNENTQTTTINIQEIVEKVAESNDLEAKSHLKALLENNTVASVIGAGVSSLVSLL
ncbi:hypothetical protein [Photobacterium phosphoreum]|uniref:hypothetical protein n=1 Tax=Photobacterium phosphoreum TaxID=659 RepID=UPI000D184463|nr:hypothetical protein [Photobacterium phosphoreum]PSU38896.1 hypothetical protein CTM85_08035 [Photobacterium phosphoreum]